MAQAKPTYSVTRTRATWKPRVEDIDPPWWRCDSCGTIVQGVSGTCPASYTGTGRTLVGQLPYGHLADPNPCCCGHPMQRLEPLSQDQLLALYGIKIDYAIVGGYNSNAVKFFWESGDGETRPTWVTLKTYTGLMTKYPLPKKRSPLIFALSDEDAYVYCDKPACEECIFMCKRGFTFYAYFEEIGLAKLPLSRATAIGGRG